MKRRPKEKREERKPEVVKVLTDTVNEIVLLAAVISDEKARSRYGNIPPEYFLGPGHAEMWAALQELRRRGLEYSPDAIRSVVGEKIDASVLDEYARSRPTAPANLKHFVDNLRWDKSRAEAAKGIVPLFIDALKDPATEPDLTKSLARKIAEHFSGVGDLRYLRDSKVVAMAHEADLTARREGRAIYGYGIPALDLYGPTDIERRPGKPERALGGRPRMVPGAAPGYTTVVAGISGHGKTTTTARMVLAQANAKRKTLWGAWEQMPGPSLELVALLSLGWSRTDTAIGDFTEDDQKELLAEMERLGEYIKFFELPFGRERGEKEKLNDRNLDLIHQYIAEAMPHIFIGDVFRYALHEHRPDEESMAIKRMNAIGKETQSHMMLINHLLLKDVERRDDKRPTRDAVMGTSGWINDVDTVIATHCPGLVESIPNDKIEFHILKQRYGRWPMVVECEWDPEYGHVGDGKTIEISKPGERNEVDDFLDRPRHGSNTNGNRRRGWRS